MQVSPRLAERSARRLYMAALAALLGGLLALVVVVSVWTYRHVRRQVEEELEQRLLSVGQAIAQSVASSGITIADAPGSAQQRAVLREELRQLARASDLGSIELLDARGVLLVGTLETARMGRPDPLRATQPEFAVALAGIAAATPLYEASEVPGTFFKTGFVPIEEMNGNVRGVVAVEGGSGFFEILPALRRTWWIVGIASACIAAILMILLLSVFRALERYERGLRATAALATAGQLAAVVAHEIRNPLAAIQSRAERVQAELAAGAEPGQVARLLEAVPIEVARLDRILTNYLSLARLAEGIGQCAVIPVVEETLELVAKDLARAGIRVSLSADVRGLRARIDPGPLRQALFNLFLNAREAMPQGGKLRVEVRPEGAWVCLEVEDSGRGIDAKIRKRIFEPFFTTRSTGSGLGLAVVDSVVRSCGGRVEVRSQPGSGSTFVLLLPRDEKGEADVSSSGPVSDPPCGG